MSAFKGRLIGAFLGLTLCSLVAPSVASATVITFTVPGPNHDLNDLDHLQMYAWGIDTGLAGRNIQVNGAKLTFTNLVNWDRNANTLYVDLLDSVKKPGAVVNGGAVQGWNGSAATGDANQWVSTFQDSATDPTTPVDSFALPGTLANSAGWIVPSNVMAITSKTFLGMGSNPGASDVGTKYSTTDGTGGANKAFPGETDPTGWAHFGSSDAAITQSTNLMSSAYGHDANSTPFTNVNPGGGATNTYSYIYTFQNDATNGWEKKTLGQYIGNDGIFAIGLDPDCHFFNTGITFTLDYTDLGPAVPEPTSMLLLGTGLIFAGRRYRRKR